MEFIPLIILVVLVLVVLVKNIVIVRQSRAYVIERLGAFHSVWQVGLHFKVPFIERVAKAVSLKEQVADFPPQPVITKDNVTVQIDTIVFFQITDPKLYAYGVEHPMPAIENLTATTLRNIIGELTLDESLTSQKQSQILVAEGERQSVILRAEASKEAKLLEAEAKAQAVLKVQEATAQAIRLLNEAAPSDAVIKIKALESFAAAADGKATKIIIPSEIQSLAGLAEGLKAVVDSEEPKAEK